MSKTIDDLYNLQIGSNQKEIELTMDTNPYNLQISAKEYGLQPDKKYLVYVTDKSQTTYSFYNIEAAYKNNSFKYYSPINFQWFTFTLHDGFWYNTEYIHHQLQAVMKVNGDITQNKIDTKEYKITISPNGATLGSIILLEPGYEIDFNVPNSMNEILGFEKQIYNLSVNVSPNLNEFHPNRKYYILWNNIISNSDIGLSNVLYSFQPRKNDIAGTIMDLSEGSKVLLRDPKFSSIDLKLINQDKQTIVLRQSIYLYLRFIPL